MASQDFTSSLTLTDAQKTSLTELEPAFEHLLRDVGLDESTIWALRHCRINDSVKSTSPTTENWPRKLCTYSMNNNTSDEDKHDTNYTNNKYTNTYTRKLHNLWART